MCPQNTYLHEWDSFFVVSEEIVNRLSKACERSAKRPLHDLAKIFIHILSGGDRTTPPGFLAPSPPVSDTCFTQLYHSKAIVGTPTAITNFSHYGAVDADGDGKIYNINALIVEARGEVDPKKQKELSYNIQLKLMQDIPAMGLHELAKFLCRYTYFDPDVTMKSTMSSTYPLEKARILKH